MHPSTLPAPLHIGLIGDYDPDITAHRAIPLALELAANSLQRRVTFQWLPTVGIHSVDDLEAFDGIWCVPGSPYQNVNGALFAIRYARENRVPFLGTCGGFQHALIEYARHYLGWLDAEHGETSQAGRTLISPLSCALVETRDQIELRPGSRLAAIYGVPEISEGYRCRYGLDRQFEAALLGGPLVASGRDRQGEVRAVELDGADFFIATLFQPERAALTGHLPPLVAALIEACLLKEASS